MENVRYSNRTYIDPPRMSQPDYRIVYDRYRNRYEIVHDNQESILDEIFYNMMGDCSSKVVMPVKMSSPTDMDEECDNALDSFLSSFHVNK